jgi:hypothetical protein
LILIGRRGPVTCLGRGRRPVPQIDTRSALSAQARKPRPRAGLTFKFPVLSAPIRPGKRALR